MMTERKTGNTIFEDFYILSMKDFSKEWQDVLD
jgi:hypothetical protein